jgi:tetratricopeptide (TPR) repeat protein
MPPVDAAAVNALVAEGERLLAYGNQAGAQEAYSKAIQLDPNNEKAFDGLRRLQNSARRAAAPPPVARLSMSAGDPASAKRIETIAARLRTRELTVTVRPEPRCSAPRLRYTFAEDALEAKKIAYQLNELGVQIPPPVLDKSGAGQRREYELCVVTSQSKK